MTRSFDTIPTETDRAAEMQKSPTQVMSVCPFCGATAEKTEGPCPRCKMENSALTRQATRARIGPWYVMQSRNPSAPGMKCNTLLALIRKGQITPRSVIRGPTTFQLWRFAARVKGISREFGLCYSCGAELQRTSTFCPRCSRSQELPPNPDVLLENEPQQNKQVVYREAAPPSVAQEIPTSDVSERPQIRSPEPEPLRGTRAPTQIPSAAETMAELADLPSPHNAPTELQSRPKQRPQEGVLTPRELAAAFSLQYDPTMDAQGARSRRGGAGKGLLTAALLLLAVGGASTFYFSPALRERFVAWIQDSAPAITSAPAPAPATPPASSRNPDWMMSVPDVPPITTAPKQNSSTGTNSVGTNSTGSNSTGTNLTGTNSTGTNSNTTNSNAVASNFQPTNIQSAPPPVVVQQNIPAPAPQLPVPVVHQAPPASTPIVTSTPTSDPRTSDAAATTAKLRSTDAGDLDQLAMDLRSSGLDAEHRQDLYSAQYFYQQVEALPRDHWPSDIDQKLKDVQRQLTGDNTP